MARIEYANLQDPSREQLAERVAGARGSVLHLYRMLMHSLPVASGWLEYLSAIRNKSGLDDAIRELVIMRISHLNRARYEADQHASIARRVGLNQQQLDALCQDNPDPALFDRRERAVLAYTDAMTIGVQVEDAVFDAVRPYFDASGIVELTATVAAYNMVSRFLEALQVQSEDQP